MADLPSFDKTTEVPSTTDALPSFEQTAAVDLPSFDATKPVEATEEGKYDSLGQQALAGAEGLAKGFAGPLATAGELGLNKLGVPGFAPEDIKGREEANPITAKAAEALGLGTGFMTGTGEAGLLSKGAAKLIPEASDMLAKAGAAALKGALEMGLIQGGDEISKSMLGDADPSAPISAALAHMGASALLGGVTGGALNTFGQGANRGLKAIENSKMAQRASNILQGIGIGSEMKNFGISPEQAEDYIKKAYGDSVDYSAIKPGIKIFNTGIGSAKNTAIKAALNAGTVYGSTALGGGLGGTLGAEFLTNKYLIPIVEKITDKGITKANQYVYPAMIKALQNGDYGALGPIVDYASAVSKGNTALNKGVEGLFKAGLNVGAETSEKDREKLRSFVEEGGLNQQMQNDLTQTTEDKPQLAIGGEVPAPEPDPISTSFPSHSMGLSAAKARVYNYLNSQRPLQTSQLPYDNPYKDTMKERAYDQALDLANKPLSILHHIKSGNLTQDQLRHFTSMYPELHGELSNRIKKQMIEHHLNEEKPPYHIRQSLSLFLGQPLGAMFQPATISSAQDTFAPKTPPMPQAPGGKKNTKNKQTLSKGPKLYQTPEQSAEADRSDRS